MRLVQLRRTSGERALALVRDEQLHALRSFDSVYAVALAAINDQRRLRDVVQADEGPRVAAYDDVYSGASEWTLLPSFDHPEEPARCLVSGTGLTHKASADNRQAMHANPSEMSDSMRMYVWGLEGGRPPAGCVGQAPEWFYKGNGTILRAHGDPLAVPAFAEDGGEEPEIAGCYVIDFEGVPYRVGMTMANEFSDHKLEKRNYLYLAPSKLRTCAIGPEFIIDPEFGNVSGRVAIERDGRVVWDQAISTGEANMCHSLANLEHHHFKYPQHRRPGDAHVHFFGADAFSFGAGVQLVDGDVMSVAFEGFGRTLRNPIAIDRGAEELVAVRPV